MSQFVLLGAIVIYLIIMVLVLYIHPESMFNSDGSYKEFGVGISGKTVFPIWLIAIVVAPISYIAAIYYVKTYA